MPPGLKSHPLIGTTLRHCHLVVNQASFTSRNSPLFPILSLPNFEPGLHPAEYPTLRSSDCEHAAKFVISGKWPSILELTEVTGTFQLPFWKAIAPLPSLHSWPPRLRTSAHNVPGPLFGYWPISPHIVPNIHLAKYSKGTTTATLPD